MGILSFLERAYFNDSKAKAARAVGLFLFCKKACIQGKSLNNKFRESELQAGGTFALVWMRNWS